MTSLHKNINTSSSDCYTFIPHAAVAAAYLTGYSSQYVHPNNSGYADTSFFLGQQGISAKIFNHLVTVSLEIIIQTKRIYE